MMSLEAGQQMRQNQPNVVAGVIVIVIPLGNPIGRAVTLKPAVAMLTVLVILDCGNEQDGLRTATSVK